MFDTQGTTLYQLTQSLDCHSRDYRHTPYMAPEKLLARFDKRTRPIQHYNH